MATQRAKVEYSDRPQPYFSKAAQRPQAMPADNQNAAPKNAKVVQGPWGKAQASYKANNGPVRSAQSTDEIFADSYAQAGIQAANNNKTLDRTSRARTTYAEPSSVPRVPRTYKSRIPSIKRKKKVSVKKMLSARVRVSSANAWIGSWAIWWYLTFQVPLAAISAVGLGMAYAVYDAIVSSPLGFALPAIKGIITYVSGDGSYLRAVSKWALSMFGIDFDPILLFITPFALVFLLGLFQLILTWFVYSAMRINSLSGKAGGIKGLMFVLAGVGYAIPILNMFPLIFLWMAVVWVYPK